MSDGCQNYDKGQMGPKIVRVPPKPYNYPPCKFCGCDSHSAHEPDAACISYLKREHSALLAVAEAAKLLPQWIGHAIASGALDSSRSNRANADCQALHESLATLASLQGKASE